MIDSYVAPEHSYTLAKDQITHVKTLTGRFSIAISGLTSAQLEVIEAALANVLVSQDGSVADQG